MDGTCTSAVRQKAEPVGYSTVYALQLEHETVVSAKQANERGALYKQRKNMESAARTQLPERHVDEHSTQSYVPVDSEQHNRLHSDVGALKRQLHHYSRVSAVLRQRLLDVEVTRRRLIERLQVDRILRSKEAAVKAEALGRRVQQHETETGWRKERNSYLREEAFQILHWKFTRKHLSDAATRLHKERNKFHKEITRFVKADVLHRGATQPSSSVSSSAPHQKLSFPVDISGRRGLENCGLEAGNVSARWDTRDPTKAVAEKGENQNESHSPTPLTGCRCVGRERQNTHIETLPPTTSKPGRCHGAPQDKSPFAMQRASAEPLENKNSRRTYARKKGYRLHASAWRRVMSDSTGVPDAFPSSGSPDILQSGSPQSFKGFKDSREAGAPSSEAAERCFDSSEPFHLQLLALRYKQELTALELQHNSPSPLLLLRASCCQGDEVRPSRITEADTLSRSNPSATPLPPAPWNARSHTGSVCSEYDTFFSGTQKSTCSKAISRVAAVERPYSPSTAATLPRLAISHVNVTSVGSMFPPALGCLGTQDTMQRVPVASGLAKLKCAEGEANLGRSSVEVCSTPVILSSNTSTVSTGVVRSSGSSRTSVLGSTKDPLAGEHTRLLATHRVSADDAPYSKSTEREHATKGRGFVAIKVGSPTAIRVSEVDRSGEGVARRDKSPGDPLKKNYLSVRKPNDFSPARQTFEPSLLVDDKVSHEWLSPEIPTEVALTEDHTSEAS